MSGTVVPFTIDFADGSNIGPHWTLNVAVESARQVESAPGGRKAIRIRRGTEVILGGVSFRKELDE
jgi:hypothetical protein